MLLNELHVDNFQRALGKLYEEWNQHVDHSQSDRFVPKEYDDMEGGAFWINAYTDDILQGQLSHVEMIRQNPKVFGLTDDGMPSGELEDFGINDPEYEAWMNKNDPNTSKMKYGVFMDGWIRGSYEQDDYFEVTGISPVIKKAAGRLMEIINSINPTKVVVEIMDEGTYKNTFTLPEDIDKLKGLLGK